MFRKSYLLISSCLLFCAFVVNAQTNYPPNTAPWTNYPPNWVYDCEFSGYGNLNPDATNLPCGFYDEPVITNSYESGFTLNPKLLNIQITSVVPYSTFPGQNDVLVSLVVNNLAPETNFTLYWSTSLTNLHANSGSFVSGIASSDPVYLVFSATNSQMFFEAYGIPYYAPPTHGNLTFFFHPTRRTHFCL
jgi:hypothetical protein